MTGATEKFGAFIRREREGKEIGRREMAKMIGVSPCKNVLCLPAVGDLGLDLAGFSDLSVLPLVSDGSGVIGPF